MSYSGDAAEQVVRMTLESGEAAVKLAGVGARQVAVLLYAILRDQKKTQGKMRLTNLLRSGKELKVFAVQDGDLRQFCRAARQYGVLYTVLRDRDAADGITDIMVRAEDAAKVNRIFERFGLATVDVADLHREIERDKEMPVQAEQDTEALLDAMLSPPQERKAPTAIPFAAPPQSRETLRGARQIGSVPPSGPTSRPKEPTAPGTSEVPAHSRPSVRQALREIRTGQKEAAYRANLMQHRAFPKKKSETSKER